MPITAQYTVLKDKTLSQNNSRGTGISYHSLTELRTNSAVQEPWKHKKKKICNVNLPLANECSNFETFFFFILEWWLLFCIPETSELIITSITTTLHLLPRMLLNWFFSLLGSLYCNEGQSSSNKTQLLGFELNDSEIWNTEVDFFFFNHQFQSCMKSKEKNGQTVRKPVPFGNMDWAASKKFFHST